MGDAIFACRTHFELCNMCSSIAQQFHRSGVDSFNNGDHHNLCRPSTNGEAVYYC